MKSVSEADSAHKTIAQKEEQNMKTILSQGQLAMQILLCLLLIPITAYAGNGLLVVPIPVAAQTGDGRVLIKQTANTTFPIVIDKPGSYLLTTNLQVTTSGAIGIQIAADNVTLDLNGFTVVGDKGGGNDSRGISALSRKNIVIKNGTVRNFFSDGVAITGLSDAQNAIIENIRASDNGFAGIVADNSLIKDCVAADNGCGGIAVKNGTIVNCEAYRNGLGTELYFSGISGINSTIINCSSNFNKPLGIYAADSTIIGCTANHNQAIGIYGYIHGGEYRTASSIMNCTANLNNTGIRLEGKSRLEGCNVRDNKESGIFVVGQHNYLIKNVISGSGTNNIVINEPAAPNYVPVSGENANMSW